MYICMYVINIAIKRILQREPSVITVIFILGEKKYLQIEKYLCKYIYI